MVDEEPKSKKNEKIAGASAGRVIRDAKFASESVVSAKLPADNTRPEVPKPKKKE